MSKETPTECDYDSDSTVSEEEPPQVLDLPTTFSLLPHYIETLEYPKTRLLGTLDSMPVLVVLLGFIHPKTFNKGTNVIRGKCRIRVHEKTEPGYCVGIIIGTSTGLIVSQSGKMYLWTLPERWEQGWRELVGHDGAEILLNEEREIRLRFLSDLKIESSDYIK